MSGDGSKGKRRKGPSPKGKGMPPPPIPKGRSRRRTQRPPRTLQQATRAVARSRRRARSLATHPPSIGGRKSTPTPGTSAASLFLPPQPRIKSRDVREAARREKSVKHAMKLRELSTTIKNAETQLSDVEQTLTLLGDLLGIDPSTVSEINTEMKKSRDKSMKSLGRAVSKVRTRKLDPEAQAIQEKIAEMEKTLQEMEEEDLEEEQRHQNAINTLVAGEISARRAALVGEEEAEEEIMVKAGVRRDTLPDEPSLDDPDMEEVQLAILEKAIDDEVQKASNPTAQSIAASALMFMADTLDSDSDLESEAGRMLRQASEKRG